jgi:hypothetical protein
MNPSPRWFYHNASLLWLGVASLLHGAGQSLVPSLLVAYRAATLHHSSVVYLKMLFHAWKGGSCYAMCMPLPGAFTPSPWGQGSALLVIVFVLPWVSRAAFGFHTHVPLESLSVSLGFDALALLPQRSLGQEISRGGGAILVAEGSMVGLYQPALA